MVPLTTEKRVRIEEEDLPDAQKYGDDIPTDILEKLRAQFGDDPAKVRQKWKDIYGDENAEGRRAQRIKESGVIYRDQFWDASDRVWKLEKPKTPPKVYSDEEQPVLLVKRLHTDKRAYLRTEVDVEAVGLRNILRNIFTGTQLTLGDHQSSLDPRYFYWGRKHLEALQDHCEITNQPDLKQEIILALEFCNKHYHSVLATINEMVEQSVITWEHLWAIFPPNVLVLGKDQLGQPRVYKILSHGPTKKQDGSIVLALEAEFVDFDGRSVGLAETSLEIEQYSGFKKITELKFFPLHMHPDRNGIWDYLIERGKRQLDIQVEGYSVQEHRGHGLIVVKFKPVKHNFRGRIMIDPAKNDEVEPLNLIPILSPFPTGAKTVVDRSTPDGTEFSITALLEPPQDSQGPKLQSTRTSSFYDKFDRIFATKPPVKKDEDDPEYVRQVQERRQSFNRLSEHQLVVLSGIVYGYCLADAQWGAFSIENVKPVNWNHQIFESLVMDPAYKSLIRRLIKNQGKTTSEFDDFVAGKGQGLVGLFYGDPGVGKTYTAEAIAEGVELPLYMVSSGAFGSGVTDIHKRLTRILELATHWGAVLLIDEADVFLARRATNDLERNAIVSVFLKEVEYYPGIMILTTNRQTDIDAAFRSRIHFCHRYPSLNANSRRTVWSNFFKKHPNLFNVDEVGLDELSKLEFNGRQIKNAISMSATLLADDDATVVTADLILRIANTLQNFGEMGEIGKDASKYAEPNAADEGHRTSGTSLVAQGKKKPIPIIRAGSRQSPTKPTRPGTSLLEPQSAAGRPASSQVTPRVQRAGNKLAKGQPGNPQADR